MNGERTRRNEAAFPFWKDAAEPGLHIGTCDRLRGGANAEADGDEADAGERRKDSGSDRDDDRDIEDGSQESHRPNEEGEPSQIAAALAERRRHEPLQHAAHEGEEPDQGGQRRRCAEGGDEGN